jgi:hypothetical protein
LIWQENNDFRKTSQGEISGDCNGAELESTLFFSLTNGVFDLLKTGLGRTLTVVRLLPIMSGQLTPFVTLP